jgi:hypothetical protein
MAESFVLSGALLTRETLSYPTHPLITTAKAHLEHT